MAHYILQGFGVHAGRGHFAAVGVAADVWGHLWHLYFISIIILLADVLEIFFPVHGYHGMSVLIEKQKSYVAINDRFSFRCWPCLDDAPETF